MIRTTITQPIRIGNRILSRSAVSVQHTRSAHAVALKMPGATHHTKATCRMCRWSIDIENGQAADMSSPSLSTYSSMLNEYLMFVSFVDVQPYYQARTNHCFEQSGKTHVETDRPGNYTGSVACVKNYSWALSLFMWWCWLFSCVFCNHDMFSRLIGLRKCKMEECYGVCWLSCAIPNPYTLHQKITDYNLCQDFTISF